MSRIIGDTKQIYVFLLDDIDLVMSSDDRIANALAELFRRVVSRSGGRVRFLFTCDRDRVHSLAALEKRTGSLSSCARRSACLSSTAIGVAPNEP